MKKLFVLAAFVFLFCFKGKAVNVTIIESQSSVSGHVMDVQWDSLLTGLGHTCTILPQTTLDNNSFFAATDVLIVSSGVIALPPNRINTIQQFLLQGGDVFLQTEYDIIYTSNTAFAQLVNALGGGFSWTSTVSGTLAPMNSSGSISTTPNVISPLTYFWYGCAGNACSNVESFLEYQGNYFGFAFCSPTPGIGKLITTSDQDWVRLATANDLLLMENIFYRLIDSSFMCTGTVYPYLNLGNDTTICAGASLNLNAGSGFNSYVWNSGSINSSITVTTSGTYWVNVTTPCNSYTDSILVTVSPCAGVAEPLNPSHVFDIYPNPTDGHFTIKLYNSLQANNKTVVTIYDALARIIFKNEVQVYSSTNEYTMAVNVPSGFYFLELSSGNQLTRKKFIVEKH